MNAMRRFSAVGAALLFLPFLCSSVQAQVRLDGIDWQVSSAGDNNTVPFKPLREIKLDLYHKYPHRLRAVVSVRNDHGKPVEGLVLRYALSLHIVKPSTVPSAGFWAVPFRTDELRISKIKAGGVHEARLRHFVLNGQFKKLNSTDFRADALKLQIMLDPKGGEDPAMILKEGVIPITNGAKARKGGISKRQR